MSNVTPFQSKHDIKQQASLWISKIDRGLSDDEKTAFAQWIAQSEAHRETLFSMAVLWDDLSVLNELSSLLPLAPTPQKKPNLLLWTSMAASLVLCSLLAWVFYSPMEQIELTRIKTDIGKQSSRTMEDGSILHLNTDTEIEIAYSETQRKLILIKGEAQFDVAPDKKRPFSVVAGEQTFTALGTIFNVQKLNGKAMELVVTEGRVLVNYQPVNVEAILDNFKQGTEASTGLMVTTGEKAVIRDNQPTPVVKVSEQQVQKDLAWMHGMLIFDGDPLAEALKEVSRYTSTEFSISDPHIGQIKVAGYFKAGDIQGLLRSLESNFAIRHHKIAKNVIQLKQKNVNSLAQCTHFTGSEPLIDQGRARHGSNSWGLEK